MIKNIEIVIRPEDINNKEVLYAEAAQQLKVNVAEVNAVQILKKSIDARRRPVFRLITNVYVNETPASSEINFPVYKHISSNKTAAIVGFGPAGMFAALRLIELNIKPIVFERGKDVQERRKDLRNLQQLHIVNPDSNYCFGEGGAGTYSDGKLYTRSTKRGDVKKILNVFVQHGADKDIMIDAHPHIGSNKLPKVVKDIRETIINCGGEVNFKSKVTDIKVENNKIKSLIINDEQEVTADAFIFATGHSARDIYFMFHKNNIKIEPKPFAMGVRIEHPQEIINEIQYHTKERNPNLPAATYNLACDVDGRGVYSFCMCPGGIIVPAATSPGEIVVNGMSLSKRDSAFANSGFVASVTEKDWQKYENDYPFSGLHLQMEVEQNAFRLGNQTQSAPAQKVTDFVNGKISTSLNKTSYIPGIVSAPLHSELPSFISKSLKRALLVFDKKMKGYFTEEAQILGVESRTSSPLRVPRNKEDYMHIEVEGLFPVGEGAGYAGGIVSAAIDGENGADSVAKYILKS
ncbi:MAG TPA: FAD-binding protein [Ignavibacteriaceae bacterium]|nr:FAD-binding protein [Ignavibacteriaceae bacterium]